MDMMNIKLDKVTKIKLIASIAISFVLALALLSVIGKKDSLLLLITSFLTIFAITLLDNSKKSILVFIVSLPFLVTARKFFYCDFLIFKVSFEAIYISALFFVNASKIMRMLKNTYKNGNRSAFNFLAYSFVFIILAYSSTIYSVDAMKSIRLIFISVVIPILFMLSVLVNFSKKDIKLILYALILQCSFSSIYGFMQIGKIAIHGISLSRISSHRMEYTFGYHNVNIYAAIALIIIPFIFERILYHNNTKKEKIFLYITGIINVFGILATFTRGAWLMFMLGFAIILISKKYRKIFYGGGILLLLGCKPIFSFILHRGMGSSFDLLANESLLARIEATITSFRIMLEYPFGIGAGNFSIFYKKYISQAYLWLPLDFRTKITVASYNMEHAHNLFLQIATELGIITSVIFIIIVINRIVISAKNFSEQRAFVASVVIFFVYSIATGGELEHKGVITGTIIFWLLFGVIQILYNDSKENQDSLEANL